MKTNMISTAVPHETTIAMDHIVTVTYTYIKVSMLAMRCILLISCVVAALLQPALLNGTETEYDYPDYYEYPSDAVVQGEGPSSENGTLTKTEVQLMIKDAVDELRQKILNGDDLKNQMRQAIKEHLDAERICSANSEFMYYDYVLQVCRSCLDKRCDTNDVCKMSCRDKLKLKAAEESLNRTRTELQHTDDLLVQDFQKSHEHEVWHIVLACMFVVTWAGMTVLSVLLWKVMRQRVLTPAAKPVDDEKAEEQGLVPGAPAADAEH